MKRKYCRLCKKPIKKGFDYCIKHQYNISKHKICGLGILVVRRGI